MRIGLALSGGAARGIAHIGVLKYLEERKAKLCCIAGTSAGSIVGSLYCSGKSVDELTEIASKMSWKDLVKISIPRKGIIDSSHLLKIIKQHLGDIAFDQLELPLLVNAVDLISGKEIVMDEGPVADAVVASCAIPGIFTPVKRDKLLLVDGGLLDNLPSALIKGRNVDYLIAVNVGAQSPLQKEPESIFEVLIQSFYVMRHQADLPAQKQIDAIIVPDLSDIAFHDTGKVDLLIKRGYEAAQDTLAEIDLAKKPSRLSKWFSKRKK